MKEKLVSKLSERLTPRLQHFADNRLTDGGEIVGLTRRLPFTPRKISVRGLVDRYEIIFLLAVDTIL
jgi:hypothetical protein